jgi:hypothetical protein
LKFLPCELRFLLANATACQFRKKLFCENDNTFNTFAGASRKALNREVR